MEILDDQGRLFGVVNIIDALVILLFIAVITAGIALVTQDAPEESPPDIETTYATLDLGTIPDYILSELNEGDSYSPTGTSTLTITDLYLAPQAGEIRGIARVELTGEPTSHSVEYDGAPPRLGRSLDIITDRYKVQGQIRALGGETEIPREETTVVLQDRVSIDDAREITAGDEIRVADRTVATIEDVLVYPAEDSEQAEVFVEASITAQRQQGALRFGDTPVRPGQELNLPHGDFTIAGSIQRVGDGLHPAQRTVVVQDRVSTADAREINSGDRVQIAGDSVATINEVVRYPTNDSARTDVFLEVNLTTLTFQDTPRFGPIEIRRDADLLLRTEDYVLSGTIDRPNSELATTTTNILLTNTVDAVTANRITAGDTITAAGSPIASVESVTAYGTNNPDEKRVFVGVSLETINDEPWQRFGTTSIQRGETLALDTPGYRLSGSIDRVDALEPRGTPTRLPITVQLTDVRESFADSIRPGLVERTNENTIARVTNVSTRPATVLVEGAESGTLGVFDHPYLRDVTVTLDLRVFQTTNGYHFKGQSLRQGGTITLDLGTITIRATVISIG